MSFVQWTVDEFIALEMGFPTNVARSLVQLFEDGCEVPFIARYRRHLIGDATPDDLRHAVETFKNAKAIKAKAEKLLKRADAEIENGALKESVKDALSKTMDAGELDSLFEPFKKAKKGSLASRAAELGVGEICQRLCRSEYVDLQRFVGSKPELSVLTKVEEETVHLLSHDLHRLEETQNLLQKLAELNNHLNVRLKVKSTLTRKAKALKETDKNFSLLDHFKLYLNFEKDVRFVQPFQILALERASSKEIINWKIVVDDSISSIHPGLKLKFHPNHVDLLKKAVQDSTKRFLIPSIERKVRKKLLDQAENSAIDCFAKNLRELLLTAPLKGYAVLAIDPGYSNGCKCALVNDNGDLLQTAVFHFRRLDAMRWAPDEQAEELLKTLASKALDSPFVIAIGNGTASRETQIFIASLIQRGVIAAKFCVVSECGASIYSTTELAAKELSGIDINLRSAVSLARRIIDPISEYVKIAPKHLGVGLYQHSVNEKRLDEMLDIVVRECVSNVGVDVNVASLQVLQRVSGLNKKTAANIIKYRQDNGGIKSREELKSISGIGPKCFEQCAGFLYVYNSVRLDAPVRKKAKLLNEYNPLDATPVHPESYEIAKQILEYAGADLTHVGRNSLFKMLAVIEQRIKERGPEWVVVWELLSNPFVRRNAPVLLTNVVEMKSLKVGDILEGIVRNHANFGIFIDIGVGFNALAHSSTLLSVVPEVNSPVKVRITRLEMDRRRIGVVLV
ncbi:transcription accessory protein [Loa loa]|uniref:Transcription accessory protein n=1 Tax=Loa loa TaxID=7209 RepID=A0A1S0U3J0_LOALO|nr:transcription accessory protein [Loa loa]EFO23916.2 transcription accessory protein [Loa loa]